MIDDRGLRKAKANITSCMTCPFRPGNNARRCNVGGDLAYGDGHQIPEDCPLRDGEILVKLGKDHR